MPLTRGAMKTRFLHRDLIFSKVTRKMTKLLQFTDAISKTAMILAAFCAFGLAFIILVDVVARLASIKFYGVPEYVRNWLVVIIFLQIPFAVRIRSMLAVDIFVHKMPAASRTPLDAINSLLGAFFFGAVALGGLSPAVEALLTNEFEGQGVVEVAAWPARFAVVFGCGVAAFYYLVRIYEAWKGYPVAGENVELPPLIGQV